MFSRSSPSFQARTRGFGSSSRKKAAAFNTPQPDAPTSSYAAKSSIDPQKGLSIAAGTLRPTTAQDRPGVRTNWVRSADSAARRVGTIDNNFMATSANRARIRQDRTFVGSECVVCEEPLEHTLRGEHILQFQCSHVCHEACFYEFISELDGQLCSVCSAPLHLDTSRGGNVVDTEKMSSIVHGDYQNTHTRGQPPQIPATVTSQSSSLPAWDREPPLARPSAADANPQYHQPVAGARHVRNDGDPTGRPPSDRSSYAESGDKSGAIRRLNSDAQARERTPVGNSRPSVRNPIPTPTVTVRSEFPTINRSRQQQTLTCLVTIEVPDSRWRPDPDDLPPVAPDVVIECRTPAVSTAATPFDAAAPSSHLLSSPPTPPPSGRRCFYPYESPAVLEEVAKDLRLSVDNWYSLDFHGFGKLRLYGTLRVGKDKATWQELVCYLFTEMLICVKERKPRPQSEKWGNDIPAARYVLKGSILIKKHLTEVNETGVTLEEHILTLSLAVPDLPQFHLRFENRNQLKLWSQALLDLNAVESSSPVPISDYDRGDFSDAEDASSDWHRRPRRAQRGSQRSATTALTEYTLALPSKRSIGAVPRGPSHVPVDVVVVVPVAPSMQGVKIGLVRDVLRYMVHGLGSRDRMGVVTFGSGSGGVPLVQLTSKAWAGWPDVLSGIRPMGQKNHRPDVVEGTNTAIALLTERKKNNPIAAIMLISDSPLADSDNMENVVTRAEAARITIYSFGLGMTHKLDTMMELSTRTKGLYTYVKDWMMLRECFAGCLGSLQTVSHQNIKLRLKLPEGSPAKFHKISGALQVTKRAAGRDVEASLGDLHFGDKRDVLVQLVIMPQTASQDQMVQDPWDNIVSGLEALGGPEEQDDNRINSIEEVPLIQANVSWADILRDGTIMQMPRPSLLAIVMLPAIVSGGKKDGLGSANAAIPPHPLIVQRRMELLTSDMLARALTLVTRGQNDRASTLLNETRSILKGLGKGVLPAVPSMPQTPIQSHGSAPSSPHVLLDAKRMSSSISTVYSTDDGHGPEFGQGQSRTRSVEGMGGRGGTGRTADGGGAGIDTGIVSALDAELESSLEWISHPAVFSRDSRKAVLQAIGIISSQRSFTFRTPIEALLAGRLAGVRRLTDDSRGWREEAAGEGDIAEET